MALGPLMTLGPLMGSVGVRWGPMMSDGVRWDPLMRSVDGSAERAVLDQTPKPSDNLNRFDRIKGSNFALINGIKTSFTIE